MSKGNTVAVQAAVIWSSMKCWKKWWACGCGRTAHHPHYWFLPGNCRAGFWFAPL